MKSLIGLSWATTLMGILFISSSVFADVPTIDASTRKIQALFSEGSMPSLKELRRNHQWKCAWFSTEPERTQEVNDDVISVFNSFGGIISSADKYKDYGEEWSTTSWAESKDRADLEHVWTASIYTTGDDANTFTTVDTRKYKNLRIKNNNLIIEISVEVKPEMTSVYNKPLALWSHAQSNPDRVVLGYVYCPVM
jgi:hypothetical protein